MYIQYSKWLDLPLATRQKIAEEFGIVKRGSTHVVDNKIQSDGYLVHEIEKALTPVRISSYLLMDNDADVDMTILWDMLIRHIENPTPKAEIAATFEILPQKDALKAKRAYKKRNA